MNSLSDASVSTRRGPRRGAVLLLTLMLGLLVLGLIGLLLFLEHGAGLGLVPLVLTALATALLLLVVGALGWHVGVRLTRQQLGDALREARMQAQMQAQLQPDWQWATDAGHHLVRWQAPQGALASSWVGAAAATQALWERFELSDESASADLRQRLQAQSPFSELSVRARDGSPGVWLLRGLASFDGQGRFAGYQGTARAQQAPALAGSAPAAAWLEAVPSPAWLLSDETPARLLAFNSPAAALSDKPLALGSPWPDCLADMPAGLVAGLREGRFKEGGRGYGLVTLLAVAPAEPVQAAVAEVHEVSEHQSFSYTVSHDLRAPLRVVEGFARILKEDYGRLLDRIGNDHLDRVMGAAARMNSMIDALLSLAQLSTQPLARQPVNLSQLAGFVVEELRRNAPERAAEVQIQSGLVVQGDPTLLRMVLENLLGNAWKYSGKCAQAQIQFEAREESGQWVYCVGDNGAGFDMRFADRLFGVFQRLHSASDFQGTGVGLASVRRIIRRHGGDIWAESDVGCGARFYFTLASSSTASTSRSA